jgi:hypothetical protein
MSGRNLPKTRMLEQMSGRVHPPPKDSHSAQEVHSAQVPPAHVSYQDSVECCLRDFFQSFYEGPFAKQPHEGGPPRISGLTQYVITDLRQTLSICQVHTASDLMAMVRHPVLCAALLCLLPFSPPPHPHFFLALSCRTRRAPLQFEPNVAQICPSCPSAALMLRYFACIGLKETRIARVCKSTRTCPYRDTHIPLQLLRIAVLSHVCVWQHQISRTPRNDDSSAAAAAAAHCQFPPEGFVSSRQNES